MKNVTKKNKHDKKMFWARVLAVVLIGALGLTYCITFAAYLF